MISPNDTNPIEPPELAQPIRRPATRRDVVRKGVRLAFVPPVVMTFSAAEAQSAGSNLSCYPQGHACPGMEPCCDGLACTDGTCGDPCGGTGEICFTDSDCCSNDCDLGVCG